MKCDAIVCPTDQYLSGRGGADAAIHLAGGAEFDLACRKAGGLTIGKAVATPGFDLPCRYVIHTMGPVWEDGKRGEEILLQSCYQSALQLAADLKCRTLAVPLISAGTFGVPKELALQVATRVIRSFLDRHEMEVTLVVYDRESYAVSQDLFDEVTAYIAENEVRPHHRRRVDKSLLREESSISYNAEAWMSEPEFDAIMSAPVMSEPLEPASLEDALKNLDESFSESLLRIIDQKGLTDAECYKKSNIDRRLFSKIRGDSQYKPKKATVLAFCVGLELSLEESEALLEKAGYALSRSSRFDIILRYFLMNQVYDVFQINETLFAFDQPLLG